MCKNKNRNIIMIIFKILTVSLFCKQTGSLERSLICSLSEYSTSSKLLNDLKQLQNTDHCFYLVTGIL